MDNYLESLKSKLELFKMARDNPNLLNASNEQIEKAIFDLQTMIGEYTKSLEKD